MTLPPSFVPDREDRPIVAEARPVPPLTPPDNRPTIRASDVEPQAIQWLWEGRVPLGMPTVFGGFPGIGKSTILYDLAARTSRQGKAVLVVTAEDHLAAVVRPRLEAAEADLDRVHILTVPERSHRGTITDASPAPKEPDS